MLRSDRLVIREIDEPLALQISETVSDEDDVATYLSSLPEKAVQDSFQDIQSVLNFVQSLSAARDSTDVRRYGAWTRDEVLIAYVALANWDTNTPEVQITVAAPYQHLGYGKEFLQTLFPWLFQNFNVRHFIYRVRTNNTPSEKIVLALGGIKQEPQSALEELILKTYHIYPS